jgi:hypothetical protein
MTRTVAIAALLAVTLCGCAMSPADLREKGMQQKFAIRLTPAAAAACVARNVENSGDWFTGQPNTSVRQAASPGHIEIVVFSGPNFFATADFAPDQGGTMATAWISPHLLDFARNRLIGAFQGC